MRFLAGLVVMLGCSKESPAPPPALVAPVAIAIDAAPAIDAAAAPVPHLPSTIKDGFHRHDRAGDPPLWPGESPAVGQQVKLQINLAPGVDGIGWLAMGGPVTKVISPTKVEADLVATTDQAPAAFGGVWRATLELADDYEFPWVLTAIEQIAKKTPGD